MKNIFLPDSSAPGKLPYWFVLTIVALTILPILSNWIGFDFSSPVRTLPTLHLDQSSGNEFTDALFRYQAGAFTHSLLEWSAIAAAFFTVILTLVRFKTKPESASLIIGIALLCTGSMDIFHVLAADRLIMAQADNRVLIPFTWAICRFFNAGIMILGISLVLLKNKALRHLSLKQFSLIGLSFGLLSYGIIHFCATKVDLPQTMFPDSLITRPWDLFALILFILCGIYFCPKLRKKEPNLFTHALLLSILPNIASQLHMAFGSTLLYDNHFNIAHFLKMVAYIIPFGGLALDYVRNYQELEWTQETKTSLGEIVEATSDFVGTIDHIGRVQYVNQAGKKMLEISDKENIHTTTVNQYHPPWAMKMLEKYAFPTAMKEGSWTGECAFLTRSGEEIPISMVIVVHKSPSGKPQYFSTISRDIREQKKIEQDLRQFRKLMEHSMDAIFVIDPNDSRILDINEKSCKSLGYSREELLNMGVIDVECLVPDLEAWKGLMHGVKTQRTVTIRGQHKRKDETVFPVEACVSYVSEIDRDYVVAIVRDITERKHIESLILRSDKLAAIGRLAAGVAHEINNPLGVISGFSQSMLKRAEKNKDFLLPLQSIKRESERCKCLVQDLLTFSRTNTPHMAEEDLNDIISHSMTLIESEAKFNSIVFIKNLDPSLPKIQANRNQIQQVIINLCNNAIDAMSNKGTLTIRTRKITSKEERTFVAIEIKDTGMGISEEVQSKIFEPFFTTKEVGKGTGLGLSLVYEIIQKHHGTIQVESQINKGTVFTATFPQLIPNA